MRIWNPEDFNKPEDLIITDDCWVNGVLKKKGEKVTVSGNDKSQLLGSKKGVYPENLPKEEKKEEKKDDKK